MPPMVPSHELIFRDPRLPHEIVHFLEDRIKAVFKPGNDHSTLVYRSQANVVGMIYFFELRFEGALPNTNCYRLAITGDISSAKPEAIEHFLRSSKGWFDFWTNDFKPAPPPLPGEGSNERYRAICKQALAEEASLSDVLAVQNAILDGLRRGLWIGTAHKEGGTNIRWQAGRFIAADYGESNETRSFFTDASFLTYLRRFFHWTVRSSSASNEPTELEAWRIIFRMLRKP